MKKYCIYIFLLLFLNINVSAAGAITEILDYQGLFEEHGSVMLIIDVEAGDILYANQAAVDFYGYAHDELLSLNIADINMLSPEETEQERRAAAAEERNFFRFTHRLAGGDIRNVDVYSYPFTYNGRPCLYSIIHDVTNQVLLEAAIQTRTRQFIAVLVLFILIQLGVIVLLVRSYRNNKQTLKSLRISETKYRSLFDNMQEGFALYEIIRAKDGTPLDYRLIDFNEAYAQITGFDKSRLVRRSLYRVRPYMEDIWLQAYDEVAATGRSRSVEGYSRETDKYLFAHYFQPEPDRIACVLINITELKLLEKSLMQEKERFRITLLSVGDGVISTDEEGRVELINEVAQKLTGWTQEDARGKMLHEVFHIINEKTREEVESPADLVLSTGETIGLANHTALIARDGTERSIADSAAPIKDTSGRTCGVVLVFRDVTEEKKKIDAIKYLSFHDSLTGLYNRRFLEEELKRLDVQRNLPMTIIVGDVNGLKLINDAFGHLAGDQLLKKAAAILTEACRADDIIARWGGDEFVIILPKTDSADAVLIIQRILDACEDKEVEAVKLSISLGYATKTEAGQSILSVLKMAETDMYKNKLMKSQSIIGQAIKVIHGTLLEKNEREAQHSKRVARLCKETAAALQLSEATVSEMETIGLMHDIGKIAIHETVLDKPGSLTNDEKNEIKRHPEVGYRILSTSNETADIAYYVLTHHERFDGKGYPAGILGEDIPLQARILAVADAYDAMTSARSYRSALPRQEAIEELQRNAGTQFDPHVVEVFISQVVEQ